MVRSSCYRSRIEGVEAAPWPISVEPVTRGQVMVRVLV